MIWILLFSVVSIEKQLLGKVMGKNHCDWTLNILFRTMRHVVFEIFFFFLIFFYYDFIFGCEYFLLGNWKHCDFIRIFVLVQSTNWKFIPEHWTRTTNMCNTETKKLTEPLNFSIKSAKLNADTMFVGWGVRVCVYHNNLVIFPTENLIEIQSNEIASMNVSNIVTKVKRNLNRSRPPPPHSFPIKCYTQARLRDSIKSFDGRQKKSIENSKEQRKKPRNKMKNGNKMWEKNHRKRKKMLTIALCTLF